MQTEVSESILPSLAAGEADAASRCMDRYGGLVWSLARRHTGSSADAEDAVQDIFIDIWKSADRFDPSKAAEATFITMIARRRLIDRHRYARRRPQTDPLDSVVEKMPDPQLKRMEASIEARLAERAMGGLEPKVQHVILLSTYQGMSHGQIAESTGIPLGTVKTYIRRGLLQVKKILESDKPRIEEEGS